MKDSRTISIVDKSSYISKKACCSLMFELWDILLKNSGSTGYQNKVTYCKKVQGNFLLCCGHHCSNNFKIMYNQNIFNNALKISLLA